MKLYARSDITSVVVGATGCRHEVKLNEDGTHERLVVDCARCEPYLRNDPGWSGNLQDPPLTYDERRAAEKAEQHRMLMLAGTGAVIGPALAQLVANPAFVQALQSVMNAQGLKPIELPNLSAS